MKNIVICCDGTRGKYETGEKNTNVVRLFERLGSDGENQVSYYDPGIGTYSPRPTGIGRLVARLYASASGLGKSGAGLNSNIREAYRYLMDSYEPGDRVYLFGYSRGAHTVRELASILHKCGLLTKGSYNLLPYATRIYENQNNAEIAKGFRTAFSRVCQPHFIGVWDTVASVGLVRRMQFSECRLNAAIPYAFQAIAVDERRNHFRVSIWEESNLPEGQEIVQVWFPGSHADVGGQDAEREVSDVPLEWMLRHAESKGLQLKANWQRDLCLRQAGSIKRSDSFFWKLLGAEDRQIPEGAKIHSSVFRLRDDPSNDYYPVNLPTLYREVD